MAGIAEPARDMPHWDCLGVAASQAGDLTHAVHCFEQGLALNPSRAETLNNLAVSLQKLGDLAGAALRYRQALDLRPQDINIRFNLAALLGAGGRYEDALTLAREIIADKPGFLPAYLLASALEGEFEQYAAALEYSTAALALAPEEPVVLLRHAEVLIQNGEAGAALAICDALPGGAPSSAKALFVRAMALQGLDRCDEALVTFDHAAAATPAPASVLASKAWLLAELGRKAEALEILDHALTLNPAHATAWSEKASLMKFADGDLALATMTRLAETPSTTHPDQIKLCFALGQSYLHHGDGEQAFAWLNRGNAAKRAMTRYDAAADGIAMKNIATAYSGAELARHQERGAASNMPVFVFGMPRSGTTLLEQILASHPSVAGLGEPDALSRIAGALNGQPPDPKATAQWRQTYLDFCSAAAKGRSRTVDKTPSNFLHAGLIQAILPGAKMIHCRRNPYDTCLSCYSLLFARGYPFTYNLKELGDYYRLYQGLMAHWRRVLAPNQFIEVDYESLISDNSLTIRRILDFCDLSFHEGCLRPHETERRVTSASLSQVRLPVYQTSAGRAQRFLPWLEALGPFPALE